MARLVSEQRVEAPKAAAAAAGDTLTPPDAAAWERFREWFRREAPDSQLGVKWDVRGDLPEGSGVVALADISKDELYMSIPRGVMITQEVVEACPRIGRFAREDPMCQRMPWLAMGLYVALEWRRSDSRWRAYLDVLPRSYDLPMMFSSAEMAQLRGSPAHVDALSLTKAMLRHYLYLYRALHGTANMITFDEFRRGAAVVMSRQNPVPRAGGGGQTMALIPGFDFTNHAEGAAGAAARITTFFNGETNASESTAGEAFKAGEQVRTFYGSRQNGALFLYQGFVMDEHSTDMVPLMVSRSAEAVSASPAGRIQALIMGKRGFSPFRERFEVTAAAPLHRRLVDFCRLASLTKEEAAFALKNPDAERISHRNEREALRLVRLFLGSSIGAYETSLDDDEALLAPGGAGDSLSRRALLAVRLRMTEKRLLARAAAAADELLSALPEEGAEGDAELKLA